MSTLDLLKQRASNLPAELQQEVLDFIDYLLTRYKNGMIDEEKAWSLLSMQRAIRGFENDPVTYSRADIKKGR